jgi:hypothetical protein
MKSVTLVTGNHDKAKQVADWLGTHVPHQKIDLDELVVSYPLRRMSWSQLLRGVTAPNKLLNHLLIDEQGSPFVWITTLEPRRRER